MFVVYLVSFDNKKPHYFRLEEFKTLPEANDYLQAKITANEQAKKKVVEHWVKSNLIHVENYSYTIMMEP